MIEEASISGRPNLKEGSKVTLQRGAVKESEVVETASKLNRDKIAITMVKLWSANVMRKSRKVSRRLARAKSLTNKVTRTRKVIN